MQIKDEKESWKKDEQKMSRKGTILFYILAPIMSLAGEILYIYTVLSMISSMDNGEKVNLLNIPIVIAVGIGWFLILGLCELFREMRKDIKWSRFFWGVYGIPLIIEAMLYFYFYIRLRSSVLDENLIFGKYLFWSMFLYLVTAMAARLLFHYGALLYNMRKTKKLEQKKKAWKDQKNSILEKNKGKNKKCKNKTSRQRKTE